jgi:hypothetical protein
MTASVQRDAPLTFGLIFMERGRFDNGGHSLFPSDGNQMN